MKRIAVRTSLGVAALLIVVLSGAPAEARTKVDHAKLATEICLAANKQLGELALPFEQRAVSKDSGPRAKVATPEKVAAFVEAHASAILRNELSALRNLGLPDEGAAQVKAALDAFDAAVKVMMAKPSEAAITNPFKKAHKLFEVAGIPVCASNKTVLPS